MPNYQLSKVYAIRSLSRPDLIYVGSTIQPLSNRMAGHRSSYGCKSRQIIDLGDAYIDLLEAFSCNSVEELYARENFYIRSMECVNKKFAIRDCPHGKIQNFCKDCSGSQICQHNREKAKCKDCSGSQVCIHKIQKHACKICSPVFCEFCNITTSKGWMPKHLKTKSHRINYKAEFVKVFGMRITNAQVPTY
jgi:hypothetical protein